MNVLITGGCGFIGSNLAVSLVNKGMKVTCFDNLTRRGTELILPRILSQGCTFVHGDIRCREDFSKLQEDYEVMVECSAQPSALVGRRGEDVPYIVNTNLLGSVNCFEFCRERKLPILFLSTSRVYPYDAINRCSFAETATRFGPDGETTGLTEHGLSETFPLDGRRTFYGATKLSSELLLQEYAENFDLPSLINRCGVIAGPWQLGKVDQGVFTYWVINHYFKKHLRYIGYGGSGKQVRDLLHIDDLVFLIGKQISSIHSYRGDIFNIGGSHFSSLSLRETTTLCEEITGNSVVAGGDEEDRPGDVIWYVSDIRKARETFDWEPKKTPTEILRDIHTWLKDHEALLGQLLGGG
jgi:CDP-paratose 2-epimerase